MVVSDYAPSLEDVAVHEFDSGSIVGCVSGYWEVSQGGLVVGGFDTLAEAIAEAYAVADKCAVNVHVFTFAAYDRENGE